MLILTETQELHLLELMGELYSFNEKRYQNIAHHLANAITNASGDRERDSFIALLKLASTVWYNNNVIETMEKQLTKRQEG